MPTEPSVAGLLKAQERVHGAENVAACWAAESEDADEIATMIGSVREFLDALPIELEKARQRWEQEVRERLGKPVTELIEYLVYSECARCELVNPERDACQCAVCDRLAVLIRNLRTESKALGVFGEEGENGG